MLTGCYGDTGDDGATGRCRAFSTALQRPASLLPELASRPNAWCYSTAVAKTAGLVSNAET
jgi:hypothetical protein